MATAHGAGQRRRERTKLSYKNQTFNGNDEKKRFVGRCGRHAFVEFHVVLYINGAVFSVGDKR